MVSLRRSRCNVSIYYLTIRAGTDARVFLQVKSCETATSARAITPVMYHYTFMTVRITDGGYNRRLWMLSATINWFSAPLFIFDD